MKRRTFEATAEAPLTQALMSALGESAEIVGRRVSTGAVYVDGRRVRDAQTRIPKGSRVSVVLEASGDSTANRPAPAAFSLEVLFQDAAVLVVNKPPGLPAQPTPDGERSLLDLATKHLGHDAGLVHRLDRETSGVTVFGVTKASTSALAAAFREGRARKEYLAVVGAGLPDNGVIDAPLQKDPSRAGRWRTTSSGNGLEASTRFECAQRRAVCLVRLFPATGRTHQLRAHLASIGFPIVGDTLYGGTDGPRCLLHARQLEIDGARWKAPVPGDFPTFGE